MLHKTSPVTITTDSGGSAIVYLETKSRGTLHALIYRPGGDSGLDTGADLTVTTERTGIPILTKQNLGTGTSFLYPRAKPTDAAGSGALGTVPSVPIPLLQERIKIQVAQGGNAKSGTIEAIYDDGRAV